jgi:hypothetical protein
MKATENAKWNCEGSTYSSLLKNELLEGVNDQFVPPNGRNLFQVWQLYFSVYS